MGKFLLVISSTWGFMGQEGFLDFSGGVMRIFGGKF